MSARSLYLQVLDSLRIYNQKARFVVAGYSTEYSRVAIFCISELAINPERGVGDLAALFKMEKSAVSRTISHLEKKGLLKKSRKENDRRAKRLELHPPALKLLEYHDRYNNNRVETFVDNVTFAEVLRLNEYLKVFADGAGAPELQLREGEAEILLQIHRLTYEHGVLAGDYLGSGYDVSVWQLLSEIRDFGEDLRISDLARKFSIPLNTLSQRLAIAEQQKLIKRTACKNDKREKRLVLLKKGRTTLDHIEATAEEYFKNALRTLTEQQIKEFIAIFKKYIGTAPELGDVIVSASTTLRQIKSTEALQAARRYAMTQIMRGVYEEYLPEYLCASDSIVLAVFVGSELCGLLELRLANKKLTIHNCILNLADDVTAGREQVLKMALEEFMGNAREVVVPVGLLGPRLVAVVNEIVM